MKNNFNKSKERVANKLIENFFNLNLLDISEKELYLVNKSYLALDNFFFVCSLSLGNIKKIDKNGWKNIIVSNYLVSPDIQSLDENNYKIDSKYIEENLNIENEPLSKGSFYVLLHGLVIMYYLKQINYPITIYVISWRETLGSTTKQRDNIENITKGNENIKIIYLSYIYFFKNLDIIFKGISEEEANSDFLGVNPIIIFQGLSWSNIVHLFKLNKININGGNIPKRHQLSISNFRLSVFLYYCRIWSKNNFYKATTNKILTSAKYDRNSDNLPYVELFNSINMVLNLTHRYKKIESEIAEFKNKESKINWQKKILLDENNQKQNEITNLENTVKFFNQKLKIEGKSTKHKASLTGRKKIIIAEIQNLKKEIDNNINSNNSFYINLTNLSSKVSKLENELSEVKNSILEKKTEMNSLKSKYMNQNSGTLITEKPSISKRTFHSKAYFSSIKTGLFYATKSNKDEKSINYLKQKKNKNSTGDWIYFEKR